jgi:hypothetical protein
MVREADPLLARLIECHNMAQSLLDSTFDSLARERRTASRALPPRIYAAYMKARMLEHVASTIYDEDGDDTTWADARADANTARKDLDDLFREFLRAGAEYEDAMSILDRAETVIRSSSDVLAGLPLERHAELQAFPSPVVRYLREAVRRCREATRVRGERKVERGRYGLAVSTRHGRVVRMQQRPVSYPASWLPNPQPTDAAGEQTPPHPAASH